MKVLSIICMAVGIPLSIVGLLVFAISLGNPRGEATLGLVMALAPWGLAYIFWKMAGTKGREAFDQLIKQNLKPDLTDWFDASGIAMDIKARKIAVASKNACKIYDFDDIRGFRSSFQSGGQVQAFGNVGVNANMQMAAANIGTGLRNYSQSGLFVRVRDVDHPEWQIQGIDAKHAARWMEIFEQYVNEGRQAEQR